MNAAHADLYRSGTVGFLQSPAASYSLRDVAVWAMDNGAFTGCYPGDDAYLALLEKYADHRDRCLFVTAPDVLGDAEQTLAKFPEMAARIRSAGYPVSLVGQDGMENMVIPWDDLDWLFIGGSTEWKLGPGAAMLAREAKARGKKTHMGRVNSEKRFRYAIAAGCDSADGTYLAFGPHTNMPKLLRWFGWKYQGAFDF